MTDIDLLLMRLKSVAESEAEKHERKPAEHVCWEAADEIERLQAALKSIRTVTDCEFAAAIAEDALEKTND